MKVHFLTPIGEKKGVIQVSSGNINGSSYDPDDVIVGEGKSAYVIRKSIMDEKNVVISKDGNNITFRTQGKVMVTSVKEAIKNISEINYNLSSPEFRSKISPVSWFNRREFALCDIIEGESCSCLVATTKENKDVRIKLNPNGDSLVVVTTERTYVVDPVAPNADEFFVIGLTSRGEFCDLYTISRETVYTNYLADGPRAALLAM